MEAWNKGVAVAEAIKGKKKRLLFAMFEPENDSVEKICREAHISKTTYYKYVNDPVFSEAVKQLAVKTFAHRLPMTVQATLHSAEKGNTNAQRLILDALGITGKPGNVNVGIVNQQADTPAYTDDRQSLVDLDNDIAKLIEYRDRIRKRIQAQTIDAEVIDEPHAIHPDKDTEGTEEAWYR